MQQAGINVSGYCRAEDLDRVRDAGLTCLVNDSAIQKLVSGETATDADIRIAVTALAARIRSHPAAFGVNLRDEPGVQQMPILGRLAKELMSAMPGKLSYVNLLPNYASPQQLGADTYEAYLREYLKTVGLPYLSWDNYSLRDGEMQQSFYDNLESVRKVTMEARIPFWNCILAQALFRYMEPSDTTFSLQVYATMAYGGRGIEFFTCFTPDIGNFRLAAVDQFGNRTATWDMLQRITNQIHALAPTLTKLHSTGVYHLPGTPASNESGTPLLKGVGTSAKLLIGEFTDDAGRPYVMVVNKSFKRIDQLPAAVAQRRRAVPSYFTRDGQRIGTWRRGKLARARFWYIGAHSQRDIRYLRLRVGDFRAIFRITLQSIVIVGERHRSDVYR